MVSQDTSTKEYWEAYYVELMKKTAALQKAHPRKLYSIENDDYADYDAIKEVLHIYLSERKNDRILILGNGLSSVAERVWGDGWINVTCVDFSSTVVEYMNAKTSDLEGMAWMQADMRRKTLLPSDSFDVIIEKAMIDVVLTGLRGVDDMMSVLLEVMRLLKPGGYFVSITGNANPHSRLPYYKQLQYNEDEDASNDRNAFDASEYWKCDTITIPGLPHVHTIICKRGKVS